MWIELPTFKKQLIPFHIQLVLWLIVTLVSIPLAVWKLIDLFTGLS